MIVYSFTFQHRHCSSSSQLFYGSVDDIWALGTKWQIWRHISVCSALSVAIKNHGTVNYVGPLKTLPSELWSFRGAKHWRSCCFALFSNLHILKANVVKCVCVRWSQWCSLWCHTKGTSVLIVVWVVWVLKWQVCAEYQSSLVMNRDSHARSGNVNIGKTLGTWDDKLITRA